MTVLCSKTLTMVENKIRVTQVYDKLSEEIKEQIKLAYPYGFSHKLIVYKNRENKLVKGLRFETDEKIYLIRMTIVEAEKIIEFDDDFDDDGNLKNEIKEGYEEKYTDPDSIPTSEEDDDDEDEFGLDDD